MKRILIVEDDGALGQGIALALDNPEMETVLCQTLQQGRQAWDTAVFDLAILDVNLPDGSGLDLLRHIRQAGAAPVILLTANDLETDVVTGLELGADDYIVKPFSLAILRARVRARLRGGQTPPVEIGPFVFDFARMEYRKNGRAVELSRTEQKLLRLLVSNRGATLSRGELVDRIWTDGAAYVDENALSVTVKRLRDKLEDTPSSPQYIKTVYGVGYTWAVEA